jgi:hypothetical protein
MQQAPTAPDPTGLGAALRLIGTPNLFRDLTGLDLNQQASAEAFSSALETAKFFGSQAAGLAQQQFQNREMDRNLQRIRDARDQHLITDDQARSLTQTALRSAAGRGTADPPPTSSQAVQRAIQRAAGAANGRVQVTRPSGSVDVRTGDAAASGPIDFDVDPPVTSVQQGTPDTCWAAAAAMLLSWHDRASVTPQAAADRAGTGWRQKLDTDQPLTAAEVVAFLGALGLTAEAPMNYLPRGILHLLQEHGPLWVVGDDGITGDHLTHVRVITGIHGNGTADGTTIRYIDPADGAPHDEPFNDFAGQIDATDAVETAIGIYHS